MSGIRVSYANGVAKVEGFASHPITQPQRKTFKIDDNSHITRVLQEHSKIHKSKHTLNNIQAVLKPISIQLVSQNQETVLLSSKNFTNNCNQVVKYDAAIIAEKQKTFESHWEDLSAYSEIGELKTLVEISITSKTKPSILASILSDYGKKALVSKKVVIGTHSGIIFDIPPQDTIYVDLTGVVTKTKFKIDYEVSLRGTFSLVEESEHGLSISQFEVNSKVLQKLGVEKSKKVSQFIEIVTYDSSHITTSGKPNKTNP